MSNIDFKVKKGINVNNGLFVANEHGVHINNTPVTTQTDINNLKSTLDADISSVQTQVTTILDKGVDTLTESELTQLNNIDSTTISSTQWGYVGTLDQGLTTRTRTNFGGLTIKPVVVDSSLPEFSLRGLQNQARNLLEIKEPVSVSENVILSIESSGRMIFNNYEDQQAFSITQHTDNGVLELNNTPTSSGGSFLTIYNNSDMWGDVFIDCIYTLTGDSLFTVDGSGNVAANSLDVTTDIILKGDNNATSMIIDYIGTGGEGGYGYINLTCDEPSDLRIQTGVTNYVTMDGGLSVAGNVISGTWNATAIGATYGGTGQTSYTVGDIIYADTTTTLTVLPDVDVGSVLISGGEGAIPSYGKVDLTLHVSGTLPVTSGGTGLSTVVSGDIIYASANDTISSLAKTVDGQVLNLSSGLPSWTDSISVREPWVVITATADSTTADDFTALPNKKYMVDSNLRTGGFITMTLPTLTTEVGTTVTVTDMKGDFAVAGTKNVISNVTTINGLSQAWEFDIINSTTQLVWTGVDYGWKVISVQ